MVGFKSIRKIASLIQTLYVAACDLYTFGPCGKDCGGGNQQAVTRMCSGTANEPPYPCGMVAVSCNTAPCEGEYIDLGEITKNVSFRNSLIARSYNEHVFMLY